MRASPAGPPPPHNFVFCQPILELCVALLGWPLAHWPIAKLCWATADVFLCAKFLTYKIHTEVFSFSNVHTRNGIQVDIHVLRCIRFQLRIVLYENIQCIDRYYISRYILYGERSSHFFSFLHLLQCGIQWCYDSFGSRFYCLLALEYLIRFRLRTNFESNEIYKFLQWRDM